MSRKSVTIKWPIISQSIHTHLGIFTNLLYHPAVVGVVSGIHMLSSKILESEVICFYKVEPK